MVILFTMKLLNDIFRRIEASRSRHGWSKNRWGREVLNNPNALYDYESGKRSPNGRTLERIAKWLDLDEKPATAGAEKRLDADEKPAPADDMGEMLQ